MPVSNSPNVAQDPSGGRPSKADMAEEARADARRAAIERAERYLSEAVPPAPLPAPMGASSSLTAAKVMEICRLVALWTPINAAMRALGRREHLDDWKRYAQESPDPFWPWAVSALQTAEGIAVYLGSDALRDNALSGDTKAIAFFLTHRSQDYAPPATRVEVSHGGTIDVEVSARATAAIERAEGRVGSFLPQVEDATFAPVEPVEPAPPPEALPKTAPGSMFKLRPREIEDR